ncbi:MAG: ribbon-helix-helix domain-containing protein [Thermoplasmatota archaeon]
MPVPRSGIVTVRLAPADADHIDEWVERGRFNSRSDFLRHAVRRTVSELLREEVDRRTAMPAEPAISPPGSIEAAADTHAKHAKRTTNMKGGNSR